MAQQSLRMEEQTSPYSVYNYLSMTIHEDGIHTENNKRRIQ